MLFLLSVGKGYAIHQPGHVAERQQINAYQLSGEEQDYLRHKGKIRVPLIENQPPLSFVRNGEADGYLNDLLKLAAEKLGLQVEYQRGQSYSQTLQSLQDNKVDLLNDYSSSDTIRSYLLESSPVLSTPFVVVGKSGSQAVLNLADLEDRQVVMVKGFKQTLTLQKKFPDKQLLLVSSIDAAYQHLRSGLAEYYIDNAAHAGYYLQQAMINDLQIIGSLPASEMGSLTLHFASDDEQPLLHSALEKVFNSIDAQTIARLKKKWLYTRNGTYQLVLTDDEQDWLRQNPLIRVAMDPDWAPVEHLDDDGRYHGISVDYLKKLEQLLGIRFETVKGLTWTEAVEAVKNKTADMFTSVSRTPQRETYSLFTQPYISMPIRIFARDDFSYIGNIDNLYDKSIAVAEGYAIQDWLEADHPGLNITPVDSPATGLKMVADGDIDVFIGNAVTATYYINKTGLSHVRTAGDTPYANNQSMAVRDDWPIFVNILKKALKSIPKQQHDQIYNHWLSIRFERATDYRLAWWVGLVALGFLSAIFYWNRTLDKQVKARTEKIIDNEHKFRHLVNSSPLAMLVIDDKPDSNILLMNQQFTKLFGYTRHEVWDVNSWWLKAYPDENYRNELQQLWQDVIKDMQDSGSNTVKPVVAEVTCADNSTRVVEVTMTLLSDIGLVVFNDITESKYREDLSSLHQSLSKLVYQGTMEDVMQTAVDQAETLTHSQIGFFHFVDKNQENVSLQVWSSRTLSEMCQAKGEGYHYPISQAGVWVDCIHQQQAVIHNNYATLDHKKGMPDGHAVLTRELTVPLFRDNLIVGIIGVGNKNTDYNTQDIGIVEDIGQMAFDFVERKRTEQQIEFMAYYDVLTGLPNRELLGDRLKQAISLSKRSGKLLAVCYLDLDGFKPVNDAFGHDTGDKLLIGLARRLQDELREGDTLARLGGDEFVILLNELTTIYNGEEIINRILESIVQPFYIEEHRILISGSIGATLFPHDNVDADALLRHADQAMYKAKARGKSTYNLYDSVEDEKVHSHRKSLEDFSTAISSNQLELYYQPKVDLSTGNVTGVEALVRWHHPEKGMLPPGAFLPLILNTPEEVTLGEWVLKNALDQYMRWLEMDIDMPVSVNISPRHIQLKDFIEHLNVLLSNYPEGIASKLELEVLETAAIGDTSHVADVMNECSKLGIHFSLDDFGTGYSSLTYFHRLPIDVLKIDQNFVRDILDDIRDLDIVEGVLRLAEALNRPVVAEGVESVEIGMMLLQLGCRYAQGYGIAKPMPAGELPGWLESWKNNSIWHQLPVETEKSPEHYDLNVSIFSHRNWLNKLLKGLASQENEIPDLSESHSQFNRWYNGIGHNRYGSHSSYAFIGPIHKRIHNKAKTAHQLYLKGRNEELKKAIDELQQDGDELTSLLKKLAEQ